MINFLRWTGRILFFFGVVGLIACGIFLAWFSGQRSNDLDTLDAGSKILRTASGDIEFAEIGPATGMPLLVLHGTPGGYDQALAISRGLAKAGFRIIAPSRPGYLRTSLTVGPLFEDQADAMVSLMDSLQLTDVPVLGFSTGARVAMEMAVRHPARVRGLVLIAPPTAPISVSGSGTFEEMNFLGAQALMQTGGDLGSYFLSRDIDKTPVDVTRKILEIDTNLHGPQLDPERIVNNPELFALMKELVSSIHPISVRESGARNDLLHLRIPQPLDLIQIICPTLVITGDSDRAMESSDAATIIESAPDATSKSIVKAGALVWFGSNADQLDSDIEEFLTNLPPPLPGN